LLLDTNVLVFDALEPARLTALPITPEIAAQAQSPDYAVADPVDRIVAATAMISGAPRVTADRELRNTQGLHFCKVAPIRPLAAHRQSSQD